MEQIQSIERKSVNGQGVVGGHNENGQQCHACLLGACRTINGIYTRPDLPSGYSLVTQIPKGACGLHVQQIKYTRNILGTKTYIRACYRIISPSHQIPMNEKRCAHLDPPALTPISCNEEPCSAAYWDGFWGQCSVSCGEGVQQFIPQCKRNLNGKLIVVSDVQCAPNKPSPETRACQERECELFRGLSDNELPQTAETGRPAIISRKEWSVGSWSSCSVTCGNGHRTRSVICPSGQCHPENRPAHAEYCNQGSCDSSNYDPSPSQPKIAVSPQFTHRSGISSWLVTEWSHCSVQCGYKIYLVGDCPFQRIGNQTRFALCEHDFCGADSKPEISRACSSEKQCDGQWFAGPWGECSDSCNIPATQRREVLCIAKIRGVAHVTNEMVCPLALKPYEEQSCLGVCHPQWFTGDWGKCEGNCPSGVQRREVRCLDIDKRPSNRCPEDKVPVGKRSCACEIHRENRDSFNYKLVQDEPVDRSCIDRIPKCRMAVQARLCSYPFYTKNCCDSCRRSQHDQIE
ncbi:hypothetical protein HUJ05_012743 [Dendroctonus ponderosae]|nr:hypothetical protein HUJ05_012743 [Dendroctonus ponderosae]